MKQKDQKERENDRINKQQTRVKKNKRDEDTN